MMNIKAQFRWNAWWHSWISIGNPISHDEPEALSNLWTVEWSTPAFDDIGNCMSEIAVPWKELLAVSELRLWSIVINGYYSDKFPLRTGGQTTCSSLYRPHTEFRTDLLFQELYHRILTDLA
jgi:hypothetical protein